MRDPHRKDPDGDPWVDPGPSCYKAAALTTRATGSPHVPGK